MVLCLVLLATDGIVKYFSTTLVIFSMLSIFIINDCNMENRKRQYRELSDITKQNIRKATIGKSKSESHKAHISQSMKRYWSSIPHKPQQTTMNDLLGIDG